MNHGYSARFYSFARSVDEKYLSFLITWEVFGFSLESIDS